MAYLFERIQLVPSYYRQLTKFEKVMFSQVFVCPKGVSVHRGVSVPGVSVQAVSVQGVSVQGVSVQGVVSVRETPPYGYVRAVRILLEGILAKNWIDGPGYKSTLIS